MEPSLEKGMHRFVDQSVIFVARLQMCHNHNNKVDDIWNLIRTVIYY
jgi:hypothetical protein